MMNFKGLRSETSEMKSTGRGKAGGQSQDCDLNGNFYLVDDPENGALQISSEVSRLGPQANQVLSGSGGSKVTDNQCKHYHLNDHDLDSECDLDHENEEFDLENEDCQNTESSGNFNPGDVLSSPIPPLARVAPSRSRSRTIIPCPSTSTWNSAIKKTKSNCGAGSALNSSSNLSSTQALVPTLSIHRQIKECHLSTVLGSARRCMRQLISVKAGLANIVSAGKQSSKKKKTPKDESKTKPAQEPDPEPEPDYALIVKLGEYILNLTRSAFTPAHRLYTSALGLHMAEDLIRNPTNPHLLNFKAGHINRSSWNSIIHTQIKLRFCVDAATEAYHRFGRDVNSHLNNNNDFNKNPASAVGPKRMQEIMVTLMHAFQDLYATALGSNEIFKVFLHIEDYGEKVLQQFLLSLESTERSELLVQVQNLRRSFDDIVISIEQLSWTAYAVFRLASEKSLAPSPSHNNSKDSTNANIPKLSSSSSHRVKGQREDKTEDDEKLSRDSTTSSGKKESSSSKTCIKPKVKGQTDSSTVRSSESRTRSSEKRDLDRDVDKNDRSRSRQQQSSKSEGSCKSEERKSQIPIPKSPFGSSPASRKTSPSRTRTSNSSSLSNRGSNSSVISHSSTVSGTREKVRGVPDNEKDNKRSKRDQKAEVSQKHDKSVKSSSRDSRTKDRDRGRDQEKDQGRR